MVKKIRLVEDEVSDEELDKNDIQSQLLEIAKSMDWKLWEMLQTIQRVEKNLTIVDTDNEDDSEEAEDEKSKK